MQTRSMLLAALATLTPWLASACGAGPATCADDDECPGRLVCDEPSGLCALARESEADAAPDDETAPNDEIAPDDEAEDVGEASAAAPDADAQPGSDADATDDTGDAELGDEQCIEEGDACAFTQLGARDGCCESFHCCPVFHICVPNFWEE